MSFEISPFFEILIERIGYKIRLLEFHISIEYYRKVSPIINFISVFSKFHEEL